ncbi:MAG: dehydratase [Tissierellia bacterium]|nr:dehydratase [Tissierellia bacterium]
MEVLEVGKTYTKTRVFTLEENDDFTKLSQYVGKHHTVPNEDDEYMNQGLLTATLPTWLGGEYNIIMYRMEFNFRRPVYTGDAITAAITVDSAEKKKGRTHYHISFECTKEDGTVVLDGIFLGVPFEE